MLCYIIHLQLLFYRVPIGTIAVHLEYSNAKCSSIVGSTGLYSCRFPSCSARTAGSLSSARPTTGASPWTAPLARAARGAAWRSAGKCWGTTCSPVRATSTWSPGERRWSGESGGYLAAGLMSVMSSANVKKVLTLLVLALIKVVFVVK